MLSLNLSSSDREGRADLGKMQRQVKEIELHKSDRTRCFGHNMPQLLALINREERWSKKPIGPIGKVQTNRTKINEGFT